ncbi:type II toxin-antitoxin system RatA family toxin [Nocardia sp. CA-151230]|uniref:type II toxin-antitoxin system RatA family toxin n=1 Tax=Nocardia sp. CA-151230 TaxID=3239982 RepID=UPI003D9493E2
MPRTTTYTRWIALPPQQLWAVLGDPARWPEWNPAITAVTLRGTPAAGVTGDYLPRGRVTEAVHGRLAKPFVVSTFVPDREITMEQPEPVGTMRLRWVLTPRDGGTELRQQLTFPGASAAVMRKVVGDLLRRSG